jgi:hypothetical protein
MKGWLALTFEKIAPPTGLGEQQARNDREMYHEDSYLIGRRSHNIEGRLKDDAQCTA